MEIVNTGRLEPIGEPVDAAVTVQDEVRPPEPEVAVPAAVVVELAPVAPEPLAAVAPPEETAPPVPANDVLAGPLVKPILVGEGGEPPVKKRGWWRR
jgi:hypothetical protein